jgi:thioredoxin reductase
MYDLIIIGGGPAGAAAGVYAARKQMKTLLITKDWGGQSEVSPEIQNWIGTIALPGTDLAHNLKQHVEAYAGEVLDIVTGSKVVDITKDDITFTITSETSAGKTESHQTRAVLIATGSDRRKLDVPGAQEFENKGVVYCASCDGPLFAGQDVAVIGGGNAALETAAQLLAYTNSVTLLHRRDTYRADAITVEKVLNHPKMTALTSVVPTAIMGQNFVTGLRYRDQKTEQEHDLAVTGIFVEIGAIPLTDFAQDIIELDELKRIKIDPWTQTTSTEGIWAAGDATNIPYHQNNIAAGDAVKAIEDIYMWITTH